MTFSDSATAAPVILPAFRPLIPELVLRLRAAHAANPLPLAAFERAALGLAHALLLAPHTLELALPFFATSPPLLRRLESLLPIDPAADDGGDASEASSEPAPPALELAQDDIDGLDAALRAAFLLLCVAPAAFKPLLASALPLRLVAHLPALPPVLARFGLALATLVLDLPAKQRQAIEARLAPLLPAEEESVPYAWLTALRAAHGAALAAAPLAPPSHPAACRWPVTAAALSHEHMVDVCGVLLARATRASAAPAVDAATASEPFVLTASAERNLTSLASAVSLAMPTLVRGPPGCGKSALITHLGATLGVPTTVKLHLSDQTDAKSLLGGYVCGEAPGEFVWQPGTLTRCLLDGNWLVIEDLDAAPPELLSTLIPVLESRSVLIPGRGLRIAAAPSFRLFATLTDRYALASSSAAARAASTPLAHLWHTVKLAPLAEDELVAVVAARFPRLACLASRLVGVYVSIAHLPPSAPISTTLRLSIELTPRDLLRFVARLPLLGLGSDSALEHALAGTQATAEVVLQAALSAFCAKLPKRELQDELARYIANTCLNLPAARAEYYMYDHTPELSSTASSLTIGPLTLPTEAPPAQAPHFALTSTFLRLALQMGIAVSLAEPLLLIGETGSGKTTALQFLASALGVALRVQNLNQQTDVTELLGGFKPVNMRLLLAPLLDEFDQLFGATFSRSANAKFLKKLHGAFARSRWSVLLRGMTSALSMLESRDNLRPNLRTRWSALAASLDALAKQKDALTSSFAFAFVEGDLVRALRAGDWVLLDEINLASPAALECLTGLLEPAGSAYLFLTERGDVQALRPHPNFRLFAAMNPATDVGKQDLPPGIRSRFSQFYVPELTSATDLGLVVRAYLHGVFPSPPVQPVVAFYSAARAAATSSLTDGAGLRPVYSLRTLTRALSFTAQLGPAYGLERALYEGFSMAFMTQLSAAAQDELGSIMTDTLLASRKLHQLTKPPAHPGDGHVLFEHFWLSTGPNKPVVNPKFILTRTVRMHLKNLARGILAGKYPILLQGPTSAGKTSMVEYLAAATGHDFVRINNHEHTDLQEYIGSYVAGPSGSLVFQEGLLVQAVRSGSWLVLDELNLAPSEVLEALNRLLDDNRELFIPETGARITPHPAFRLFATQNPPGLYGGRKVLSKAFANRFLQLHVEDIPADELAVIIEKRCAMPKSYATKMVAVMTQLQRVRSNDAVFAGKHGFITPRDLFRWAERSPSGYDQLALAGYMLLAERLRSDAEKAHVATALAQHLKAVVSLRDSSHADDLVLTPGLTRMLALVAAAIAAGESVLLVGATGAGKTTVCQLLARLRGQRLVILNVHQHTETSDFLGSLRPLRNRSALAAELGEKLAAASALAPAIAALGDDVDLDSLIAAYRDLPQAARAEDPELAGLDELVDAHGTLFAWYDGPLPAAMKAGDMFLIDEISLAEDAVLERLNSVLEPSKTLVLAEKGGDAPETLRGAPGFAKELSPALRNRFTEIWVPPLTAACDLAAILDAHIAPAIRDAFPGLVIYMLYLIRFLKAPHEIAPPSPSHRDLAHAATALRNALASDTTRPALLNWSLDEDAAALGTSGAASLVISIRDMLAWAAFINITAEELGIELAALHGAAIVFLDGLASPAGADVAADAYSFLAALLDFDLPSADQRSAANPLNSSLAFQIDADAGRVGIPPFMIPASPDAVRAALAAGSAGTVDFAFDAPTPSANALRVLRALQLPGKPILLEGSPGVGKTSLVVALARAAGKRVVRINLSEQTDIMDLFGSDLPVEGGAPGQFAWRDGVFLQALRAGDWVLLDELNLASQSVLEGLNACLDHRAEVFIPELGRTFPASPHFRLFACQNPLEQGGGRKGLPKSFLNRFTQVYLSELTRVDLLAILRAKFPTLAPAALSAMVDFNAAATAAITRDRAFARAGAPWEFNLRDTARWCELVVAHPDVHWATWISLMYLVRMRTPADVNAMVALFERVTGEQLPPAVRLDALPALAVAPDAVRVGLASVPRLPGAQKALLLGAQPALPLEAQRKPLEALLKTLEMRWMAILVGPPASGKTSLVRAAAGLTGHALVELAMNHSIDAMELLGGFEQMDLVRHAQELKGMLGPLVRTVLASGLVVASSPGAAPGVAAAATALGHAWHAFPNDASADAALSALDTIVELVAKLNDAVGCEPGVVDGLETVSAKLARLPRGVDSTVGRFEWLDGALISALESGAWVLLDNANLASAAVLDRLNPLLEPNGVLTVTERGMVDGEVKVIVPHPEFRLILALDPQFGEVSRAMRNRGVEIVLPVPSSERDLLALTAAAGVPGKVLPLALTAAHTSVPGASLTQLRDASALVVNALEREAVPVAPILSSVVSEVYGPDAVVPSTAALVHAAGGTLTAAGLWPRLTTLGALARSPATARATDVTEVSRWLLEAAAASAFGIVWDEAFASLEHSARAAGLDAILVRHLSPADWCLLPACYASGERATDEAPRPLASGAEQALAAAAAASGDEHYVLFIALVLALEAVDADELDAVVRGLAGAVRSLRRVADAVQTAVGTTDCSARVAESMTKLTRALGLAEYVVTTYVELPFRSRLRDLWAGSVAGASAADVAAVATLGGNVSILARMLYQGYCWTEHMAEAGELEASSMSLLQLSAGVASGDVDGAHVWGLYTWWLAPLLCHAEDDLITLLSSGAVAAESYEGVERIAVSLHQIFGLLAQVRSPADWDFATRQAFLLRWRWLSALMRSEAMVAAWSAATRDAMDALDRVARGEGIISDDVLYFEGFRRLGLVSERARALHATVSSAEGIIDGPRFEILVDGLAAAFWADARIGPEASDDTTRDALMDALEASISGVVSSMAKGAASQELLAQNNESVGGGDDSVVGALKALAQASAKMRLLS
ncbi:uncharacterized protein AMSG_11499 [Thecamonas trahens ATCC 50062]|uniref:Midasin n=1 Tax=Thecamonas trahens ATCC 50062 TaxID=461836 RepID=A0A0L0DY65_THETB|nr:hypothetical protein AMSG_11499 [Thecamonas trahens ATCC 50062]KNC56498.1 hypothetical protein AMSG_11499 [Thecamonas trahens ATCC 50062]|eukprot:XP_013752628.1 hypothetical protein AMSG_11499 [Thecamonas trahens ATCC 50062]